MDKSGNCDSDDSITWEDLFGSSNDFVPTLLTMYDTLIAETHGLGQKPQITDSPHEECSVSETITSTQGSSTDLLRRDSSNSSTYTLSPSPTIIQEPKIPVCSNPFKSTFLDENNGLKPFSNNFLPKCNSSLSPSQQCKFGLLSRSFSKWSSRITDRTSNRTPSENSQSDNSVTKLVTINQRPLSVNSTVSSTSNSSCSSCSSTSMNWTPEERIAPKASLDEEEDALTNFTDEEGSTSTGIVASADNFVISSVGSITGKDGCFSTLTAIDQVDSGQKLISGPMTALGRQKLCNPNLSYMDRIVMEVVETERIYVTDLKEIISGYLGHWKSCSLDDSLGLDDITELFSNIEEIHAFNSEFVTKMENCGLDPVEVAKCFVSQKDGFSVYTQYCTQYPRTMFILTEMMRQEKSREYFRERQTSLGHSLPLGSYLLKPVQRILKYHLLLQNIVKHYDGREDGYTAIVEALSAMTNIAHHINDMKRKHEHAVRVQEIQSLLYGWQGEDLTTFGELYAEGTFRIYGAKALRHIFLFDRMLLITKKKEDGILGYKSHIMCSNLMLIESVPGELLSFHVIPFDNPRLQCTLQAKNSDQKREWTQQLKRVILENYHAVIPTHARQLVMELGQCRPEDCSFMPEKVQSKRQHSAPEYLEKRKQEKDRRKSESTLKAKLRRTRQHGPINPKEVLGVVRRSYRRGSMDSHLSTTTLERNEAKRREEIISGCPNGNDGITEKRLVKKLSGWRRKSESGFRFNGVKGFSRRTSEGLMTPALDNAEISIDSTGSIDEEIGDDINESSLDEKFSSNLEQRRESIEEIVGQLVMQNREFQRILSKQRLVHLRKSLALHQQRQPQEEESASDAETEDSHSTPPKKHTELENDQSQASSSSNGIGSSSDVNEDSHEDIHAESKNGSGLIIPSKNVQRTVSDPGNKSALTPRRFINGPLSQYDPFALLWSSFRRHDRRSDPAVKKDALNGGPTTSTGKSSIRHTHSFTCSMNGQDSQQSPADPKTSESEVSLPHGDSGVFANSFTSDSSSSSEANIPTLPSVWLKQQGEHLPTPSTKSGSLPRSFQVTEHDILSPMSQKAKEATIKSRQKDGGKCYIPDRPVTIASDKPGPSDLNYPDMEQYISRFKYQHSRSNAVSKDIDELTPITSLENLSLHPDHKIYARSSSKTSIKDILLSMTHRLSGKKGNRTAVQGELSSTFNLPIESERAVNFSSCRDIANSKECLEEQKDVAKSMRNTFLNQKSAKEIDSCFENCEDSVTNNDFEILASSGLNTIGERLAHCTESSYYALSKILSSVFDETGQPQSISSTTSTATNWKTVGDQSSEVLLRRNKKAANRELYLSYIDQDDRDLDGILSDSDEFVDGFYERSFEAIENFLEDELIPDKALCLDQGPIDTTYSKSTFPGSKITWKSTEGSVDATINSVDRAKSLISELNQSRPASLSKSSNNGSRLICSQTILEKLKHLEQCAKFQREVLPSPSFDGLKSIQQRRNELELWKTGLGNRGDESETSSQHSTSTINTVIELSPAKYTSFPSSRRCSDTESSGGNSPLTERAVSATIGGRSQSQGHLCATGAPTDSLSKGWVKLVVGKLEGEGDSC